jgi:hypothetical protein
MGWQFRKSIKIAPGVRINVSRSGVSTSVGGRGATVNIGRKGTRATVDIPGTGISFSQRVGGGGSASNQGAAQGGGCAGAGCLGLFMLVLLGVCMGPQEPSSRSSPAGTSSYSTSSPYGTSGYGTSAYSAAAETQTREWFYIHGTLNVRAEPRGSASVVRTLRRGDYVQLGPKDANGWAALYSAGSTEGYVYRASDLVQRQSPTARSLAGTSSSGGGGSRRSSGSRVYHTGPRGGCYYYNRSGNKQYVDRSNCR